MEMLKGLSYLNQAGNPARQNLISLSSFMLKTLERHMDRFLRRDLDKTLSTGQGGKSTETALYTLETKISVACRRNSLIWLYLWIHKRN